MITFVIGGTRSGKSLVAERLAEGTGAPVTYVATAEVGDEDFRGRVDAHRARRPAAWKTVESDTDLAATMQSLDNTVIVDSLGAWVARLLDGSAGVDIDAYVETLCRAIAARRGSTIVVSEEVGLGVHPASAVGLRFADALGECNRRVASVADRVLLVVAGRALSLPAEPNDC
jgi:adenosylcobinamide kinase/adenosylcobinamide-phosphate guanylyltransferase